jgi:hypothetical protein
VRLDELLVGALGAVLGGFGVIIATFRLPATWRGTRRYCNQPFMVGVRFLHCKMIASQKCRSELCAEHCKECGCGCLESEAPR